jgi:hypothetical protein
VRQQRVAASRSFELKRSEIRTWFVPESIIYSIVKYQLCLRFWVHALIISDIVILRSILRVLSLRCEERARKNTSHMHVLHVEPTRGTKTMLRGFPPWNMHVLQTWLKGPKNTLWDFPRYKTWTESLGHWKCCRLKEGRKTAGRSLLLL